MVLICISLFTNQLLFNDYRFSCFLFFEMPIHVLGLPPTFFFFLSQIVFFLICKNSLYILDTNSSSGMCYHLPLVSLPFYCCYDGLTSKVLNVNGFG